MTPELRAALGELGYLWGDSQAGLARYEQEGTSQAVTDAVRRLDRLRDHLGIVKAALRKDVDIEPLPVTQVTKEMVGKVCGHYRKADAGKVQTMLELALGLREPVVPGSHRDTA